MIISKEFEFEAAHVLPFHNGKCANLHGHSYRVRAWVKGPVQPVRTDNPESGMVIDFGRLSEVMKPLVDGLDHTVLNYSFDYPTAECIAEFFHKRLKEAFASKGLKVRVRVYETRTSYAETEFDD